MCTPCTFRNEPVTPINWCIVCKEGLCKHCSNYHKSSKTLEQHDLVPFKNRRSLPEFAISVQEICFEHKRQLDFFCCVHQDIHCIKCSTLDHKNCNSVLPLEDVVRNAKSSVAFCHIEESLNILLSKFQTILNKSEESITINASQINDKRSDVNLIKNGICNKLEKDIREFLSKLDTLKSDTRGQTNETIRGLKEKLNVVRDLKANVALLKENGTDFQIFSCLKHLESNISKEENHLTANLTNCHYESIELVFRPSDAINTLQLVGSIGEIEVQKKPLKVNSGSMGQRLKVVKSTKESMLYRTDEVIHKYRPYSAVLARLCLISVFLLDCIASLEGQNDRNRPRFYQLGLSYHLDLDFFVQITIYGQIVGCLMLLFRRKIKIGCGILTLIKISQIYLSSHLPDPVLARMISIYGIILMAYADTTEGKSLFASTSSTFSAKNWKAKSIGKILILLMYIPLLAENVISSSWKRLICGLCLIVSITVGYRINISAALMIVWLLFGSLLFAGQRDLYRKGVQYWLFINTLVISGGLLLMLAHGSENLDLKKKT